MLLNRARAFILILAVGVLLPGAVGSQTPAVDPSDIFFDDTVLHDIRLQINERDLESLHVDVPGALARIGTVGPDRIAVAESGIAGRSDVVAAAAAGASAILVGETLMRADDPSAAVHGLLHDTEEPPG